MAFRPRASTPRTRHGCSTCRQRRIKCDEERPSCQRCIRSGWRCPGYPSSTASDQVESKDCQALVGTHQTQGRTLENAINIVQYNLPFKVPGTQEERRALHYFSTFAAPDLDGDLPSGFWSHSILQRCQQEVPVRHAAAALGRLHMEYSTAPESSGFAATQATTECYGKAIKTLRRYLDRDGPVDRRVVLMCSAIFYSFELIRGQRDAALKHLQSGLDIMGTWQRSPSQTEMPEEFIDVFAGMDLQATIYNDARAPALRIPDEDDIQYPTTEVELRAFSSVLDMKQTLFPIIHSTFRALVRHACYKRTDLALIPPHVVRERQALVDRYDRWRLRLGMFEHELQSLSASLPMRSEESQSTDAQRAIAAAKLHFLVLRLLLLHSLQDSLAHSSPSFEDAADEMLDLARGAMLSKADRRNSFSLHLGIVAPIFLLAMKTTEEQTRRAAIELLQAVKGRREGFYDAYTMAQVIAALGLKEGIESPYEQDDVDEAQAEGDSKSQALEWVADRILGPLGSIEDLNQQRMERLWAVAA